MTATADLPNKNIKDFTEKLSFAAGDKWFIIDSEDGDKLKLIPKTLMKWDQWDPWDNGADWVSFVPKWAYDSGTEYIANDVVSYLGSTWIALQTTTGNTPSEWVYWTLNAAKGTDGTGSGDMMASMYDPTSVEWDAFDMDNMAQGTTNKYVSAAEKTVIENTSWTNTGDEVVATWAEVDTGTNDTKMVTPKAMEDSSYMKNPMTASWDVIYGWASGVPTRLAKGTDDQVLTLASWVPTWADATGGSWGGSDLFAIAWTIWATGTNVANTILINATKTISSVDMWFGTAGNGTTTIDVNKNGTTIFSANPSITTTDQYTIDWGTLSTTSLASGDLLTLDIDAVAATTAGVDLYVRVNYA